MGGGGDLNSFDNNQLALEYNQAVRMGEIDSATQAAQQAQVDREQRASGATVG